MRRTERAAEIIYLFGHGVGGRPGERLIMREGEQADHGFAGRLLSGLGEQGFESARIGAPRKSWSRWTRLSSAIGFRRRE